MVGSKERPWKVLIDSSEPIYLHHASCATEEGAWKSARKAHEMWPSWVRINRIGVAGPFENGSRIKWLAETKA